MTMTLHDVMQALAGIGSSKISEFLNVCAKIESMTDPKRVDAKGKVRHVSQLVLVDDTDARLEVSVWDAAYDMVQHIPVGEGLTLIGCTATRELEGTKVILWDGAFVRRGGSRAEEMTEFQTDGQTFSLLTASFSSGPLLAPDAEGFPTCAAALADAPHLETER